MQILHEQQAAESVLLPTDPTQHCEQTIIRQQATSPPATRKRMVSKRRYVVNIGKKVALSSASLGFLLVASCTLIWAFAFVSIWRMPAGRHTDFGTPEEAPPFILGCGITSLVCYFLAWRALNKAGKVETGVPLTRATTADLPALDTLVRASSEPMQEQEAVLLRAAAQRQETPPEQLVRASSRHEQE